VAHTHAGTTFDISCVVVGPLHTNVYLVTDRETNASLLVDPGAEPEAVLALGRGSDVQAVVATHGHHDHHDAVPAVTEALDVAFLLHHDDEEIAGKTPDWYLDEGALTIGETTGAILHTPGHTPGSICLAFDGVVLSGDTLFPGGPGATRFPYSSFPRIIESIRTELFTLDDTTVVLPGHGPATTIGSERPQLDAWIERGW
jgi:glyoxylase-like metal-dependent hydrolase (beta-lactamase superfamily II)